MSQGTYKKGKTVQPLEAVNVPNALLRMTTIQALAGVSRATIYRRIRESKFPKPVQSQDGGLSLWRASDVKQWLDSQTAPT